MHRFTVFAAAAVLGFAGSFLLHAVKTLTILGLVSCALCVGAVAAFALFPSVALRKMSIRLKHAVRDFRTITPQTLRRTYEPQGRGELSFMVVGTFVVGTTFAVYEIMTGAGAPRVDNMQAAVQVDAVPLAASSLPAAIVPIADAAKQALPVLAPALTAATDGSHPRAYLKAHDSVATPTDEANWIWLIRALFADAPGEA